MKTTEDEPGRRAGILSARVSRTPFTKMQLCIDSLKLDVEACTGRAW